MSILPLLGIATVLMVLAVYGYPRTYKGSKVERKGRLRIALLVCVSMYGFVVLSFSIPVEPSCFKGAKPKLSLGQILFSLKPLPVEPPVTYQIN